MLAGTPSRPRLSGNRGRADHSSETAMIRVPALAVCMIVGIGLPAATWRGTSAGVRFEDIAQPKPGTWPTYDGNQSGNRFSPLDQINTSNVQHLAPKWMFTISAAPRALEVTPLVADGVMYVTSVNEAYALDASTS